MFENFCETVVILSVFHAWTSTINNTTTQTSRSLTWRRSVKVAVNRVWGRVGWYKMLDFRTLTSLLDSLETFRPLRECHITFHHRPSWYDYFFTEKIGFWNLALRSAYKCRNKEVKSYLILTVITRNRYFNKILKTCISKASNR